MEYEEQEEGSVANLINTAKSYIDTRIDLFRLTMVQKATATASSTLSRLIAIILFIVALLFLSVGAAICIGISMQRMDYGFFIVGGAYIVIGIAVFIFKRALIKAPVAKMLIKKALK